MNSRFGLALTIGALLVSLFIAFGMQHPISAQDLFPTPEGRLGGRMPLPTGESLPADSLPQNTPAPSGHPLAGVWLLTFAEPDQAAVQAVFGNDGIVTFIDAAGNRGSGVWIASGQQSGVVTLAVREVDASARPPQITILNGPIEVETAGDAVSLTYSVETVDESGATSERTGPFTATGHRVDEQLVVPTPE